MAAHIPNIDGLEIVPVAAVPDAVIARRRDSQGMQADGLETAGPTLVFAYSSEQAEVIVSIAEEYDVRAVEAAAYVSANVHPDAGVLDSKGNAVTTIEALAKNTSGLSQRPFHLNSNLPFFVEPPAWFPRDGMPNLSFSFS